MTVAAEHSRHPWKLTVTIPDGATKDEAQAAISSAIMSCLSEGICYRCGNPLEPLEVDLKEPGMKNRWDYTSVCQPCGWHYRVSSNGWGEHITARQEVKLRRRFRQ